MMRSPDVDPESRELVNVGGASVIIGRMNETSGIENYQNRNKNKTYVRNVRN